MTEPLRVLVCGDREWRDQKMVWETLDQLLKQYGTLVVIEGDARGADRLAGQWAVDRKQELVRVPADWAKYGRAAGPIRNTEMLAYKPELVVAFHDALSTSKGTLDMVTRAEKEQIEVLALCHVDRAYDG